MVLGFPYVYAHVNFWESMLLLWSCDIVSPFYLQMDNICTLDAVSRCKDEIARLSSEIENLERKKNRLQWLKVGSVSYKHLCGYRV